MNKSRVIDPRVRQLKARGGARAITALNEAVGNGELQVVRPADGGETPRSARLRVVGPQPNRVKSIQ